jgi:hypothetical protein
VEISCDNPFNPIHFSGYNLVDNGEAGVPVKALYDYDAAEPDELTFKIGNCQGIFYSVPQLYKIILTMFCDQIMWSV